MKLTNLSLLFAATSLAAAKDDLQLSQESNHDHYAHHDHGRADSYAPIGVMGDHLHRKGTLMASYRYMFMQMNENFEGSNSVSDASVRNNFLVSPTDMDMEMHMIGLMYSPTDKLTFMAMLNLVELSMNHERRDGVTFKTESSGLGDSSIGALLRLNNDFHVGLAALLPSAEVSKRDFIPGPGVTQLPYPMQLGAGSWGVSPSLTYRKLFDRWSFGAQAKAKFYLSDNSQDYRVGDSYELTSWVAAPITNAFSLSFRATLSDWGNFSGRANDLVLPLGAVPTVNENLRGGTKLNAAIGLNYHHRNSGINFGVEFSQTLWQDLDGPQLGEDFGVNAGVRFSF